jgi:outer membrane protein assembly factor BamB
LRRIGLVVVLFASLAPAPAAAAFSYDVPLDPASPWPKFRRDAAQMARSPIRPRRTGGRLWAFRTGRGIFSSPVIGGDGTVFVGSADRVFYAIRRDGRLRWRLRTGEIVDSAALLDDRGRVYFGSGDGHLYARDARTGRPVWTYAAEPASSTGAFINWFEGNVGIQRDGTLIAPNDNFRIYGLDRSTGARRFDFRTRDQTWALPAVDVLRGTLVAANNYFLGGQPNVFGLTADAAPRWQAEINGSVVASPLLTGDGSAVAGGFDGFVHAYDVTDGRLRWTFPTRDHIYSSAAALPDGTLVVASTDGTVYALDPASGRPRWRFDTLNPIRSSPAVDAEGNVYIGGGDGRLIVLDRRGRLRWAMRLTTGERATLNASPALGRDAIVIADSEGVVFSVPYDWCLRTAGGPDRRCLRGPRATLGLGRDGARLLWTSPFGIVSLAPPSAVDGNQPIALSLVVRRRGATQLALIDPPSLRVRVAPAAGLRTAVSGDRRYVVVTPTRAFRGRGGAATLTVTGSYVVDPKRNGLALSGGRPAGRFSQRFRLAVQEGAGGSRLPLPVPRRPGDRAGVWLLNRPALPLPSLLPSYNQIGFDSLDFLVGLVERHGRGGAVAWMVGARPGRGGRIVADPRTSYLVPFTASVDRGLLTLSNTGGASVVLNGFAIGIAEWRIAARLARPAGAVAGDPRMTLTVDCGRIGFYGPFLEQLGLCARGRPMRVFGGAAIRPYAAGVQRAPTGVGTVSFARAGGALTARLSGSRLRPADQSVSLLALDARTGTPVPLDYGTATTRTADAAGHLESVRVPLGARGRAPLRLYLMVDAYPAARGSLP